MKGNSSAVALKLNCDAHFPARKAAGDVSTTGSDAARGPPGADRGNRFARGLGQSEPGTKVAKTSLVEQFPSLTGGYEIRGTYFRARELRSFFRANVYLRPASDNSFWKARPLWIAFPTSSARFSGT